MIWTQRFATLVWMLVRKPIGQPATGRFYCRAEGESAEEELGKEGLVDSWRARREESEGEDENELERERRRAGNAMAKHVERG